ncbi:MAG: hypothetical protein AAFV93_13475, partial [Chloroflexota bacterium]
MTSDVQWQNYLDEVSDALLTGNHQQIDKLRSKYGIAYKDDHQLVSLIEDMNQSFMTVEPSAQFSSRLKNELIGVEQTGVVWRIRKLPARVQWAAIVATILGGGLLVLQRLLGASESLRKEER